MLTELQISGKHHVNRVKPSAMELPDPVTAWSDRNNHESI
ncbi:hypothetical protein M7I_2459 [Glarea lozoyensis 74030]|uniref:Uncharacterized protein n=1 Tax=Glarea lozoyensis (strain ATCC 74030 / MF5533) TaxID=1104152 RepID=H0EIU3_GLAL7|nr:hypothetical protein M7I_2459 [Glarea lozoyensis 74030]